jgi:Putative beta-barrel porin 2
LNHNDYKLDAGLIWLLGDRWDGKLDTTRTHNMVPFLDLSGSQQALSIVTEQRETVQVGLKLNSLWKILGSAYTSSADQPIVGAPNLHLNEASGTMSIDYLGINAVTSALTASYLSGDYSGASGALNPSYTQSTIGFLADYKHFRTLFEGQVGYSRRVSDAGTNSTSGFTGLLDLKHQLTPKTTITAKVDRTINSYFLNASSEIDSEAGLGVNWQATYKLSATLDYTFTYRDFPRQGNNPVGADRIDIQEYWTLGLSYQPRRWLIIKPYANLLARRTTFVGAAFSSTIFGVSVTVMTPDNRIQAR